MTFFAATASYIGLATVFIMFSANQYFYDICFPSLYRKYLIIYSFIFRNIRRGKVWRYRPYRLSHLDECPTSPSANNGRQSRTQRHHRYKDPQHQRHLAGAPGNRTAHVGQHMADMALLWNKRRNYAYWCGDFREWIRSWKATEYNTVLLVLTSSKKN